jgi:hypothetical protein
MTLALTLAKEMVATVEMYEPRMPSWVMVEPMNYTRGYHSSAVLGGSIYTFGGVKGEADTILDVVGCYCKNNFLTMSNSLSAMHKFSNSCCE